MATGNILDYMEDNNTNVVISDETGGRQRAVLTATAGLMSDGGVTISRRHTEGFGAVRQSTFNPACGWTFAYNINAALIVSTTDGVTGSVSHVENTAHISTGTDAAGYAQIQTLRGNRYVPGIGGLCRFTAVFTQGVADSTQYVGYIDDQNGWAFGYNGTEFGILRRSKAVDVWIPQSEWNINKYPTLDPTKGNVYQIEYRWLGYGAQTFAIESGDGSLLTVHQILYANINTETSVDNPNLPITARVENSGNTTDISLETPSAIAGLDGDQYNTATAVTLADDVIKNGVGTGTNIPILTLRNPTTWLTKNNRLFVQALRIAFATEGAKPVLFRVYANATITGGSYADIAPNISPVQSNTTFTSATGGTQIGTFPLGKASQSIVDLTGSNFNGYPGQEITILADVFAVTDIIAGVTFRQFL